jgi:hypothetical protein
MKVFKSLNKIYWALIISTATYLIFIGKFLLPNYYFWGSDATFFYYPSRFYLHERIFNDSSFPFWTEKLFMGFPIYVDAETGYLNPINILSIILFGPDLSYKILHLLFYLVGSISFYYLLRKKGVNLFGYLIANTIFFFSTYLLNHQIHFNIILTFYLFPTAILLLQKYIEEIKIRYLVLISIIISFGLLFGHFQSVFIFCLGMVIYYLIFNYQKLYSFQTLFLIFSLFFLILIQTSPQIIPLTEIYPNSVRDESINLFKGSYVPIMTSFAFIPYVFGDSQNYFGDKVKEDFSYTEIYIYFGISTFLLFAFILILKKTDKDTLLSYSFLWLFLIFSIIKYNNFFSEDTPLISLFRYWERIVILPVFGISILIGKFVGGNYELNIKNIKKRIFFLLSPIVYIAFFQTQASGNIEVVNNVKKFLSLPNFLNYQYFTQFIIIFSISLLLLFSTILSLKFNFFKKNLKNIVVIYGLIIFCDLYYFSLDVVRFRLQNISEYKQRNFNYENNSQRSIFQNHKIKSLEYLYINSWSLFGDSQFVESNYKDYLAKNGFTDIYGRVGAIENIENLEKFGITRVFKIENGKEIYQDLKFKGIDLIQNDIEKFQYIVKKPGNVIFEVSLPIETTIFTRIKYTPNWEVKINGQEVKYESNEIFLKFKAPAGENVVEIKYIPKPFYLGLQISGLLLLLYIVFLALLRKYKYF